MNSLVLFISLLLNCPSFGDGCKNITVIPLEGGKYYISNCYFIRGSKEPFYLPKIVKRLAGVTILTINSSECKFT
jgi:hypothetical protein